MMPELDDLKTLWKCAAESTMLNESLDSKAIRAAIKEQSIGISAKLLKNIQAGILALTFSVPLFAYNLQGYAGNALILKFCIAGLILSGVLLPYLLYQYARFNSIDRSDLSLHDLIVAKINFFQRSLSLVPHAIAIGLVLLILAINLLADNNAGSFQVNNIWLYIAVTVTAYLIMLVMLHLMHTSHYIQYTTALNDLNRSKLSEINVELKNQKRTTRIFLFIIVSTIILGIFILFLTANSTWHNTRIAQS